MSDFNGPEPGTKPAAYSLAPDGTVTPLDSLSSIEIDTTAKGDPKLRVKVYARSNDPLEVQRAVESGLDLYRRARGQLAARASTPAPEPPEREPRGHPGDPLQPYRGPQQPPAAPPDAPEGVGIPETGQRAS